MDLTRFYRVLDTETTGLNKAAEVCEISIIDGRTGLVLLDTLVKPSCRISKGASDVHGITDEMVADAPTWDEIHDLVVHILTGTTVLIYQQDFDLRLMSQSAKAVGRRMPKLDSDCAMRWVHDYIRPATDPKMKWPKLTDVAEQYGVEPDGVAHRSLCDTKMTRDVILAICAEDQMDYLYREDDDAA